MDDADVFTSSGNDSEGFSGRGTVALCVVWDHDIDEIGYVGEVFWHEKGEERAHRGETGADDASVDFNCGEGGVWGILEGQVGGG